MYNTTHRNSGKYSSSSSKLTSLSLRYLIWLTEYPLRSHCTFISSASGPPFVMIIVKSTMGRCSCPSNSSGLKSSGGPPRGWCRNSHLTCMSSDPLRRCRRKSNFPDLSFSLKGLGGVLLYFCKHLQTCTQNSFQSSLASPIVSQHKLLDIWSYFQCWFPAFSLNPKCIPETYHRQLGLYAFLTPHFHS